MLPQRVEPTGNEVVLLFTDGQANRGLTSTAAITDAVRRTWGRLGAPAVHTFGFGSDHNEDMLRSVAASNKGMYYFIGNGGEIPAAFADCLGGLTSIVARRLQLVVEVPRPLPHAVEVLEVVTKYSVKTVEAGAKFEVTIPDLYSEEQRDVVFRLRLGRHTATAAEAKDDGTVALSGSAAASAASWAASAASAGAVPLLRFQLAYRCVAVSPEADKSVVAVTAIARPAAVVGSAVRYNERLDEQRNRIECARAIEDASATADRAGGGNGGDEAMQAARKRIEAAKVRIAGSRSGKGRACQELQKDLDECMAGLESRAVYRSFGRKANISMAMSHQMQRSCMQSKGAGRSQAYSNVSKARMKAKFKRSKGQ